MSQVKKKITSKQGHPERKEQKHQKQGGREEGKEERKNLLL